MKILHIGKFYAPIEGGIESINRVVVDALKVGNQQRVISYNNRRESVEEDIDGIPIIRASILGIIASQPLSLRYFWELRRAIRLFHPDIVHLHYPNPLAACYAKILLPKATKLIVHWHSDIVEQSKLYRIVRPLEGWLLKTADAIIATSPNYRDASLVLRPYLDKVKIIPCSMNKQKLDLTPQEQEQVVLLRKEYQNKPIIFFVGRHVQYKGLQYLLQAERFIKHECMIVIAGKGDLTETLKKRYTSPRIRWIGRLSDEQLRIWFHAADLFAFPSITRNEAFGVVLIESMYCSCPSVTFTIEGSGVNWVSPHGVSAIQVTNSDAEAYGKAIDELLGDPDHRKHLASNAHQRSLEKFSEDVVEEQYRKLYKELVS